MGLLSQLATVFSGRTVRRNVNYAILLVVIGAYIHLAYTISGLLYNEEGPTIYDAVDYYGFNRTVMLYLCLSATIYITVPLAFLNIFGIIISNPFSNRTKEGSVTMETPFVCFRVVTKGMFQKLVADVTQQNLDTCRKVGMKNFKIEIVTDVALNLNTSNYVREIVVPSNYITPNGTLFKARALHYCLDQSINILSRNDWIVHLDEETLLTESVIHGIIEFITKPKSNVGQGVITYGGCVVENWITTLLDGIRVCIDYGLFRLGLGFFHRPMFGFKGSFVVVKMAIEQKIGFDFGPRECIAEDLRFALTAWHHGYRFDFVRGIMKERSTFSLSDYIKQRKRWFIGHFHVIWSNSLPAYCKIVVCFMNIVNILLWTNILNAIFSFIYPVPLMKWQVNLYLLMTMHVFFMLAFGNFMSIPGTRYNVITKLILCFLSQLLVPVLGIVEAWACLKGFFQRNELVFDIVQKEMFSDTLTPAQENLFEDVLENNV